MGRGPGVVTSIMANVLKYNQELVKQLSEVNHATKTKESGKKLGQARWNIRGQWEFGRYINPITIKGGRLYPPHIAT